MELLPEDILKILLALLAGGLIGIEREFRDKAAGFRTLIFICIGAALFTIFSHRLTSTTDPNRIAANIVSGVGFLGAGVILRSGGKIVGLTTAATIWLTAALGMGLGGGQFALTGVAVLVVLVVLWAFPALEHWIDSFREERTYEITCSYDPSRLADLEGILRQNGLTVISRRQAKTGPDMFCSYRTYGSMQAHSRAGEQLFADPAVKEFRD